VDDDAALQAEVEEFLHSTTLFRGPDPENHAQPPAGAAHAAGGGSPGAGIDDLTRTIVRNKLQVSANESRTC